MMALTHAGRAGLRGASLLLAMAVAMFGWGQAEAPHALAGTPSASARSSAASSSGDLSSADPSFADKETKNDLAGCGVYRVTSLPGSHEFASDFIEAVASDPRAKDADLIWGLTADLSTVVPYWQRALYISKSSDGGATWRQVA
ncbi:MAG: hypothetical protein ABI164_06075, partial [Acidobacteriaceae bacterium]